MSTFHAGGFDWQVSFDAFTLADAKKETGIDLADISAGGWHTLETDASAVGRVLAVVCADEIKARKMNGRAFSKLIRGEAIDQGRAALLSEGADFFPRSEWSGLLSNLAKRKTMEKQAGAARMMTQSPEMLQMMDAFLRLPPDLQSKLIAAKGDTSSLNLEESGDASGPAATPSPPATDSPESADLAAVG